MISLGIDPGLSGAIAVYTYLPDASDRLPVGLKRSIEAIWEMPTMKVSKGRGFRVVVDLQGILKLFERISMSYALDIVVLEQVSGMPTDGGSRAFTFGESYGIVRAAVASTFSCRHELVPASVWKRHMKIGASIDDVRKRADELLPGQTNWWRGPRGGFLDGHAEAAMLALYGKWILEGSVPQYAKKR